MNQPEPLRDQTSPGIAPSPIRIVDLGRMSYDAALALQRASQASAIDQRGTDGADAAPMDVFLVEHDPPVITISRRPGAAAHLLADEAALRRRGIEVKQTDRGGDITYHGPGQLVVYPILDLNRLGLRVHSYMRFLEEIAIDTLSRLGIAGTRDERATGVWVNDPAGSGGTAKICAVGVRVSRWVAMHGLALNVAPELEHFRLIVPCGLTGRAVTSVEACRPDRGSGGGSGGESGKGPRLDRQALMDDARTAVRMVIEETVARRLELARRGPPSNSTESATPVE